MTAKIYSKICYFFKRRKIFSLHNQDKFLEAIHTGQKTCIEIKTQLGENSLEYLDICTTLAELYFKTGLYDKSEKLFKKALKLTVDLLGDRHPHYADLLVSYGNMILESGDFKKADDMYRKALQIREIVFTKNHPKYATSLINIADIYKTKGEYEAAEAKYKEALEIITRTIGCESETYASCINNLSLLYVSMGKFEDARGLIIQALEIHKKIHGEKSVSIAPNLVNYAWLLRITCQYPEAEAKYREGLSLIRHTLGKNNRTYPQILNNLAGLYTEICRFSDALSCYQETLEIYQNLKMETSPEYARALNNLGGFYSDTGNYSESIKAYQNSLNIYRSFYGVNHPNCATLLRNIGHIFSEMGDNEKALQYFHESSNIYQKTLGIMHPDFSALSSQYAGILLHLGHLQEAEKKITQSIDINIHFYGKEHPIYANSRVLLAFYKLRLGQFSEAERIMEEAILIVKEKKGKTVQYAKYLNDFGCFYLIQGEYHDAEKIFKESLAIYKEFFKNPSPVFSDVFFNLALVYAATSKYIEALSLFDQVIKLHDEKIGQIFSIGSEKQRIGYLDTLERHKNIYLSFVNQFFSDSPEIVQSTLDFIYRRKAIIAETSAVQRETVLGNKYPHLQEKFQEISRLRMQIAQKTLNGPGPEGIDIFQKLLQKLIQHKDILESELSQDIPEVTLEQKLKNANRHIVAHCLPPGSVLVEFVRYNEYNFLAIPWKKEPSWKPARYLAFVIREGLPDTVTMTDLGEAEVIDNLIEKYHERIKSRSDINPHKGIIVSRDLGARHEIQPDKLLAQLGDEIRKRVIDPILSGLLKSSHLFLSPDGALTTFPFEVLPFSDGKLMIDKFLVSYVSVGRDILRFEQAIIGSSTGSLILANPEFNLCREGGLKGNNIPGSDSPLISSSIKSPHVRMAEEIRETLIQFEPLDATQDEGEQIGVLLGVKPFFKIHALESIVKSSHSPKILHLATHGYFLKDNEYDFNHPVLREIGPVGSPSLTQGKLSALKRVRNPLLRSGLAFAGANTWLKNGDLPPEAEDGILTAEDVTGLDLTDTQLVVLSACETGLGAIKVGEGVFGFRRSFIIAGAKTLVMSLWSVPDEETKELMIEFYKGLLHGKGRAESLRDAQLAMKAKNPDPLFWAAFICQGDPGPISSIN